MDSKVGAEAEAATAEVVAGAEAETAVAEAVAGRCKSSGCCRQR